MGVGTIARHHRGEILIALCAAKDFIGELDLAEAYALRRAIELCSELNIKSVILEGDAQKLIKEIKSSPATYA